MAEESAETEVLLLEQLVAATIFYAIVFLIAELSRKLLDLIFSKKSLIHRFFIEIIGTVTICVCVFENAVIIMNYGLSAFFVVSTILGFCFGYFGRGAFGNPMAPLELFLYGEMPISKLLVLFIAQVIGGMLSYRTAVYLWYLSLDLTSTHYELYLSSLRECQLNHAHPYIIMVAFEIAGGFIFRTVFPKMPSRIAPIAIPAFISATFTFSIAYMGDAGLDPIVGSALFSGCHGLSAQHFMLQYWFCPVIGWLLAAYVDRSLTAKSAKTQKKSQKKKQKQQ